MFGLILNNHYENIIGRRSQHDTARHKNSA